MRGWGYKTPNHKVYKTSRFVLIIIRNKDDCTSIHVYVLYGLFGHSIFQEELPFDLFISQRFVAIFPFLGTILTNKSLSYIDNKNCLKRNKEIYQGFWKEHGSAHVQT